MSIWRELKTGDADNIAHILNKIFLKQGPLDKLLMDNGTEFYSEILKEMLDKLNMHCFSRAVHRPSGNVTMEIHCQMIKTMVE